MTERLRLTDSEFEAILQDGTKRIVDPITWKEDEDHSPAWEFRIDIKSESGWPLVVVGRYNAEAGTLTYALILKTEGRIYGLDLGRDHHNPQCDRVGEKHKHRWSQQDRDKTAYVPDDVTAPVSDPVSAWTEFCAEARRNKESCGDGCTPFVPAPAAEFWNPVHVLRTR